MSKGGWRVSRYIAADRLFYAYGPIFATRRAAEELMQDLQRTDPGEYKVRPAYPSELNFQGVTA